jgi:DNA-binding MarR family transcriptional regulator
MLEVLSIYGSFTASGLAERLGESSGATSYHLRQLAKHGFVREVEGKGTSRERWWERSPGGITIAASDSADSSHAVLEASKTVLQQWERGRSAVLSDFIERGLDVLPREWADASAVATASVRLTVEQLATVVSEWELYMKEVLEKYRGKNLPGSRPVQIHFNAFPVLDGEITPEDIDVRP